MAQEQNQGTSSVAQQLAAKREADRKAAEEKAEQDKRNREDAERNQNQAQRQTQETQASNVEDNAALNAGQGGNQDMINEAVAKSRENQGKDPRYPLVAQSARAMIKDETAELNTQAPATKQRDELEAQAAAKLSTVTAPGDNPDGQVYYLYSVKENLGGALPDGTPIRFKGHYMKTRNEKVKDYLLEGYARFVTEIDEGHYKLAEDVLLEKPAPFVDDPLHPVVDDRQFTQKSPSHP